MELNLVHLYPDLLNIYGDQGNIIALKFRCLARGIKFNVLPVNVGDKLTAGTFDLVFGGGGQDQQQLAVSRDLLAKAKVLKSAVKTGIPMLTICGSYQLFGRYFKTAGGKIIKGISIFDAYTRGGGTRKIGNIVINLTSKISNLTSNLVGFENHSGNTYLKNKAQALGTVIAGFGNNGSDGTEGCRVKNVIGCYLHGSLLPKNPHLTDWLIQTALEKKYQKPIKLKPIDDKLEWQAHRAALRRVKIFKILPGW